MDRIRSAAPRSTWIRGLGWAVMVAVAWIAMTGSALAQAPAVSVFPSPGSTYAEPGTQIVFRGIPPGQIGSVQVVGSKSGVHTGTIEGDSDGQGGSFLPTTPFTPGETVTVTTGLNVIGGKGGVFKFSVCEPYGTIAPQQLPIVPAGSHGVQHFRSQPGLVPASITITKNQAPLSSGDFFLTPQYGPVQNGPMLLGPRGKLLWFDPLPKNMMASDFRVQELWGQPVLTWWQGYSNNGSGRGQGIIYNSHYQEVAVVNAANGMQGMDLHEFLVTNQGDAWIIAVEPVHWGGEKRPVMNPVVQEIDIKTGLVLFEWNALAHIPVSESFFKPTSPGFVYDPYHLNSISLTRDGNVIVSMRNTWGIYEINRRTGAVMWTLGTNHNQFKMGPGTGVAFQHDVLVQPDGDLTIFDDGAGPPTVQSQARGMLVSLNTTKMTDTLVAQYEHTPALSTNFEGNVQVLPNGGVFIGWGQQPYFTEFNSAGKMVFDAHFTVPTSSYRAYRFPWSGQPLTQPAIALGSGSNGATDVYASWNGATDVAKWRVLGGASASTLAPLATSDWNGFETTIAVRSVAPEFAVQALGSSGQVLATSPVEAMPPHIALFGANAFVSPAGVGGIPATCDTGGQCDIATTITAGRTVIARTGRERVGANGGGVLYFALTHAGRSLLAHARGARLPVHVVAQDVSGLSTSASMNLIPFHTSGSGPRKSAAESATLRIMSLTDFVSSSGVGGVLAGCFSTSICHVRSTLTVGRTVIARTGAETLGSGELGYLIFSLTSAGRSKLAHARGNQLATSLTITDGSATAGGQISLVRFR